jgi:betaine-aldehyde dehydrogenase
VNTFDHSGPPSLEVAQRDWRMLIDGELVGAEERADVYFPGTGEAFTSIPRGTTSHVDLAVAAAKRAFSSWARTPITRRAQLVIELADAIEQHGDELAFLDTIDNGSPISVMRGDYRLAVEQMRFFAGLALQLKGETVPVSEWDAVDFSLRQPFGVVVRIVPFNHPLLFAASRIAAPLMAGNSVVLKPAEATSLSALRLGELAKDILPMGVLNIVSGPGSVVGDRLVSHPDVRRIAFTGSEEVGRSILARAAEDAVKVITLELGGKNPMIVFADADIDAALDGTIRGMNFAWQGQSCGSTSRLFVHASIYDTFLARLGRRMDAMVMGDPRLESTQVGPVVSAAQYAKVSEYIEHGLADSGLVLIAGGRPERGNRGYFIRPTLFSAPGGDSGRLFSEEIFGPVLVAAPFEEYDDVIGRANCLPLGLTASVWTTSLKTAMASVRDLETGYAWVNWSSSHIPGTAFGGVKNSGLGREESLSELEGFTQSKNVYLRF